MSEPKVEIFKLSNCPAGFLAEYLIVTVVKPGQKYKNAVRVFEYIQKQQAGYKKDDQGNTIVDENNKLIPIIQETRRMRYEVDDFFTDHEFSIWQDYIQVREIKSDDPMYEPYLDLIDEHKRKLAEIEAQRLLQEKQRKLEEEKANRKKNRAERRHEGKKKKRKKKMRKRVRSNQTTH